MKERTALKTYAPSYYKDFHCIADKCGHTCCAGWDVDIDEESLKRYKEMKGGFADRLTQCIDFGKDPHFILTPDGRCPLLNESGLCELIIHEGEDALCQICRDHPRFRNFWTGRVEIGLGMACEEAARLILSQKEPLHLELIGDTEPADEELPEDEQYLMQVRKQLLEDAAADIESIFCLEETETQAEFIKNTPEAPGNRACAEPLKRLAEYLIYRHIADALYDDRLEERTVFIQRVFSELSERWTDGKTETLAEIVRSWSNEFEYDTDRIGDMLDKISDEIRDETPEDGYDGIPAF